MIDKAAIPRLTIASCQSCLDRVPRGTLGWRRRLAEKYAETIKVACERTLRGMATYPATENAEAIAKDRFHATLRDRNVGMPIGVWLLLGGILWDLFWAWWQRRQERSQ